MQVRQDIVAEKKAASESKTSPERLISEFKLTTKAVSALAKAGINTAGDVLAKLEGGEKVLLEVEGFGRKSLIDLKKQLRQMGYQLPAAAEEIEV
ncbi:MAG: DNA-directed RNA polymerase subunit alpha C-terminal domain-containing protein [Anaerolineaceae bacterium]